MLLTRIRSNDPPRRKIEVLHDEDIFVAVKPWDLVSQYQPVTETLQGLVREQIPGGEQASLCSRLDKWTSGLSVGGFHKGARSYVAKQFERRKAVKLYLAMVDGVLEVGSQGDITKPLAEDQNGNSYASVEGKESHTSYQVLSNIHHGLYNRTVSLVMVKIHTGRKHQIRAHFQAEDMSVVGDPKYGSGGCRMLLHASYVAFNHPSTQREVSFLSLPPWVEKSRKTELSRALNEYTLTSTVRLQQSLPS